MRYLFSYISILFYLNTFLCVLSNCAQAQDSVSIAVHRVKDNGACLYGYKNAEGKWVLEPQFESAGNFVGKYAIVKREEKCGVINQKGEYMLPLIYDHLFHVRKSENGYYSRNEEVLEEEMGIEGLYIFMKDEKYGIIRAEGNIIIPAEYSSIDPYFKEGMGLIAKDTLFGFADTLGFIIQPQFSSIAPFENGIAYVSVKSKLELKEGYINKKGNYILPLDRYHNISFYDSYGLYSYKKNGKSGLFNSQRIILKPEFDYVDISDSSYILVKQKGKYGIVNSHGKFIVSPQYDSLLSWTKNKVFFYKKGRYGILNKENGKQIEKIFTMKSFHIFIMDLQ
jgi:hypothetical protein